MTLTGFFISLLVVVLVDSSVWIEALRRDGDLATKVALEAMLEADAAMVCGPVVLEVLGGCGARDRRRLRVYLSHIPYRTLPDAAWRAAIRLSWTLRKKGVTIPWNDLLIGALSLMWRVRVYARDAHFEALGKHGGIQLYVPGRGGAFRV